MFVQFINLSTKITVLFVLGKMKKKIKCDIACFSVIINFILISFIKKRIVLVDIPNILTKKTLLFCYNCNSVLKNLTILFFLLVFAFSFVFAIKCKM